MAQRRKKKTGKRSRRRENERNQGGSMMSMRSGLRNLVGSGDRSRPRQRGSSFLTWLLVIVIGIVVVMWLTR